MLQSLKYAQWALRAGIAFVFLWFGIGKFLNPEYWISAWVPGWMEGALNVIRLTTRDFMYLSGMFEVLVAVSILSGLFVRFFAGAAIVFLVSIVVVHGLNEVLVRDAAIVGGLLALMLWPDRRMF